MTPDEQRLREASHFGWTPELVRLLDRGTDPNTQDIHGNTPLHLAVQGGQSECVRLLLDRGMNPNTYNEHGETPLHFAVWSGHAGCARLLLIRGADPESRDSKGRTAREIALKQGHLDCVDLLDAHMTQDCLDTLWHGQAGASS